MGRRAAASLGDLEGGVGARKRRDRISWQREIYPWTSAQSEVSVVAPAGIGTNYHTKTSLLRITILELLSLKSMGGRLAAIVRGDQKNLKVGDHGKKKNEPTLILFLLSQLPSRVCFRKQLPHYITTGICFTLQSVDTSLCRKISENHNDSVSRQVIVPLRLS